jgi:hypothetical protein
LIPRSCDGHAEYQYGLSRVMTLRYRPPVLAVYYKMQHWHVLRDSHCGCRSAFSVANSILAGRI